MMIKEFTCIIKDKDKIVFSSTDRGIAPLLQIIDNGIRVKNFVALDKIVGKAAALLYVYMEIGEVHAEVMSETAKNILTQYNIKNTAQKVVRNIINRQGTDICPMEKTVENVTMPNVAYKKLKVAFEEIKQKGVKKMAFENVKKNFGFGCMRLPMIDKQVDLEQTKVMVDQFMANGFNYFDTAKGYLGGQSEIAVRECVVKRYPRQSFTVTDKLTAPYFNSEEEIYQCFEKQLEAVGVDYFDFYLMHAQGRGNYEKFKKLHAYEIAQELKKQGKIKHVGLSFHDTADYLDMILTEHPEVEVVQIQLNYIDFDDTGIQARECLDVCIKHNKPVIVMEPVKGGALVNLPPKANEILQSLNNGSNASYAIRFAASQQNVFMVLSGMSNIQQMQDNLSYMKEFKPLDNKEKLAIDEVCKILRGQDIIPCTACRYCIEGCPKQILIPDLFSDMNVLTQYNDWNSEFYYHAVHTKTNGKASDCIKCGKCEQICPQHLPIRNLLEKVAEKFDNSTDEDDED